MEIYIVQSGDNIYSIANRYGISVTTLIQDNGLINPYNLVIGQAIVITYPSQTHSVEEGDTIASIATTYGVTIMQLLRNNSFLMDREYIYPGETIVISYNTNQKTTINGFAYPYIDRQMLKKTLPYLTYLSVFNYRIEEEGEITIFSDDSEIIKLAVDYGTIPLLMISALSPQGERNIELVYMILFTEDYQNRFITNLLNILKLSGYYGVNFMISEINEENQNLYNDLYTKISNSLKNEGYQIFVTINPDVKYIDDKISFEQIDYSSIGKLVNGITFLQYVWGRYPGPPTPVSSINLLSNFVDYVVTLVPPEKIAVGKPLIAYDWTLPYNIINSYAASLTLNSAIILAHDVGAIIQFDETSQTPFFQYQTTFAAEIIDHIVWFIDARSISALDKLMTEYSLAGSGIWNIMVYYQQIWTLIISQFEIVKLLPVT